MALELNADDLKLLRVLELKIACEIKRVCELHDIKYSLAFGTMLGAVRHGGFIPWDDDIDIIMPKEDYNKFLYYAENEFSYEFQLVNYETNDECGEPFTKIMLKNTVFQELFTEGTQTPNGVFVDIFPYDNRPDELWKALLHRFKNYELKKRILIASGYKFRKHGLKKIIYRLLWASTLVGKKRLITLYRSNQTRYDKAKTKRVVALGGNYGYEKDSIPADWLDEYTTIQFEDTEFKVIKKYRDFLSHYYGDFMKLPPVEDRVYKHKISQLDLTQYGGRKSP